MRPTPDLPQGANLYPHLFPQREVAGKGEVVGAVSIPHGSRKEESPCGMETARVSKRGKPVRYGNRTYEWIPFFAQLVGKGKPNRGGNCHADICPFPKLGDAPGRPPSLGAEEVA